jgi:hypothetical protein
MERFALVTSRRSGTTLVIDCLNNHPRIDCVKRAFGMEHRIANPTPDNQSGQFYLYRTATLARRARFLVNRRALLEEFIENELLQPRDGCDVVGFRLLDIHARGYPQILDWAEAQNLKLIHLVRENLLKVHVSHLTARLHKLHHPRDGEKLERVQVALDVDELIPALDERAALLERLRARISGFPLLSLSYESFVEDRSLHLERMASFLGVSGSEQMTSDLVKINPSKLSSVISNYAEVARALEGTPHAAFLDATP